ncbi:MAG: hypothetical protein HOH19_09910 [Kordiimonadaceae bacterium]|jgi:tetratricopeptide (TPR) repeat protein|nr:hypothetical protein [Kordiimonadaceae bacterium]MBT6032878.1 hypothetical protein [Kordiimonadaceae bacterium]
MTRLKAIIFAIVIMIYIPSSYAQGYVSSLEQSKKYQHCLKLVEEDPAAAISFSQEWRLEGGAVAAQHCQALSLYEQDKFVEAASLFDTIVDNLTNGENVNTFALANKELLIIQLNYLSGLAWRSAGEYDKAYNVISASIIDLAPQSIYAYDLYIERGFIQVLRNDPLDAIKNFTLALEIDATNIDAFLYRAESYRKTKEHLKARLDLNAALTIDPNHPDLLFESGINYRLQSRNAEARLEWSKLIDKYPGTKWQKLAEDNIDLIEE